MRKITSLILSLIVYGSLLAGGAMGQVASGGAYTLNQTVIASGGGGASIDGLGNLYGVEGTVGQAVAGSPAGGGPYTGQSGFWLRNSFVPTAAGVAVGGRVSTAQGRGIKGVILSLTDRNGNVRRSMSSTFGYYRFFDVPAGETYVLGVRSRRFRFGQPNIVLPVVDEMAGVDFVADP